MSAQPGLDKTYSLTTVAKEPGDRLSNAHIFVAESTGG
jgi:hypothetical protein